MTECPVCPCLINQNDWHEDKSNNCHQRKSVLRRSCISNRQAPRRIQAGYHNAREQACKVSYGYQDNSQAAKEETFTGRTSTSKGPRNQEAHDGQAKRYCC